MNVFDDRRPFVFCLPVPSRKRLKLDSVPGLQSQKVLRTKTSLERKAARKPEHLSCPGLLAAVNNRIEIAALQARDNLSFVTVSVSQQRF